MSNNFSFTRLHKFGFWLGLFLIIVGLLMYVPDWARHKQEKAYRNGQLSSPVWLEQENNRKRKELYDKCVGRGDQAMGCTTRSYEFYPDRNWKQIAEKNKAEGML